MFRSIRLLKISFFIYLISGFTYAYSQGLDSWIQKADFPGTIRNSAFSFSILGKGYTGSGMDSLGNFLSDFWEYDPVSDSWQQKADFAGNARTGAIGFTIDSFAYAGLGFDGLALRKDLWRYDPISNTWSAEQDLGFNRNVSANARRDAAVASLGNVAYVIGGYDGTTSYVKECWQFDPHADTSWTKKRNFTNATDFSSIGRRWGAAFSLNPSIYFGTGYDYTQNYKKDFWKYNPATDTWSQVADLPGQQRANASGFSIYGKGYILNGANTGQLNDMWRYDPASNMWAVVSDYPGGGSANNIAFTINNRAFVGLGTDSLNMNNSDIWEYIPDSTTGINEEFLHAGIDIYPNPVDNIIRIRCKNFCSDMSLKLVLYNPAGKKILEHALTGNLFSLSRPEVPAGIYFYNISSNNGIIQSGKLLFN